MCHSELLSRWVGATGWGTNQLDLPGPALSGPVPPIGRLFIVFYQYITFNYYLEILSHWLQNSSERVCIISHKNLSRSTDDY